MPNKRDLKRTIHFICDDVIAECIALSLYEGGIEIDNIEALFSSINAVRNDFISRISHPEPGMSAKEYYDKISTDFAGQISEIIDNISNLK